MKTHVLFGMPTRNGTAHVMASAAHVQHGTGNQNFRTHASYAQSSVLTVNFNSLLCVALNAAQYGLPDHEGKPSRDEDGEVIKPILAAMIHDDVCPDPQCLDVLHAEMVKHNADFISAVVPITDGRGVTSTGIDDTGCEWNPRKLTMTEIFDLPATFTDPNIIVNSGLWLMDLTRPWVDEAYYLLDSGEYPCFQQLDRIVRKPNGRFEPEMQSEDWAWSRTLRRLGAKIYATRKIGLYHKEPHFHNRSPWGQWKTDEGAAEFMRSKARGHRPNLKILEDSESLPVG